MRRLPHLYVPGKWLFVTWHLHGSLPEGRYPPPDKLSAGQAFVWMDRYLDTSRTGPMFLKNPTVAEVVLQTLRVGAASGDFDLRAWVIMSNHVHVLIRPNVDPSKLMQRLKGISAKEANRVLGRTGRPFWQAESYDHLVRNEDEFNRIVAYIESNPVKAGIAQNPEDFCYSSACGTEVPPAG